MSDYCGGFDHDSSNEWDEPSSHVAHNYDAELAIWALVGIVVLCIEAAMFWTGYVSGNWALFIIVNVIAYALWSVR